MQDKEEEEYKSEAESLFTSYFNSQKNKVKNKLARTCAKNKILLTQSEIVSLGQGLIGLEDLKELRESIAWYTLDSKKDPHVLGQIEYYAPMSMLIKCKKPDVSKTLFKHRRKILKLGLPRATDLGYLSLVKYNITRNGFLYMQKMMKETLGIFKSSSPQSTPTFPELDDNDEIKKKRVLPFKSPTKRKKFLSDDEEDLLELVNPFNNI